MDLKQWVHNATMGRDHLVRTVEAGTWSGWSDLTYHEEHGPDPGSDEALHARPGTDGTIVGVKLRKSSGVPAWDDAAERGLRRTEKVPRDIDGRIFPALTVVLQPKAR